MENKILGLFVYSDKLKFNEIEKALKTRSNKLDYHLKKLIRKEVLIKSGATYSLSKSSEYLIPYSSEKKAVLPVILIHIGTSKNVFLVKREKRPYKGKLSLPGGRLILGESIEGAVKRIMKDKYNISCKLKQTHSISLEHIQKSGKIINSFLLIFVSASAKDVEMSDIDKQRNKIIKSDYYLLKNNLELKVKLDNIYSKE